MPLLNNKIINSKQNKKHSTILFIVSDYCSLKVLAGKNHPSYLYSSLCHLDWKQNHQLTKLA